MKRHLALFLAPLLLAAAAPPQVAVTGGRIVGNLAKMLHERGGGRGLISICAAGGQGVVAILER